MVHNQIKKEEPKLLRDILELVQTAIIKLYIEGNKQDRIHDFFNTYAGQNGGQSQIYLNQEELQKLLETQQSKEITQVTLALMYEYTNQYKEALEKWTLLKSNEGCERTIEILKKAGSKEWIE